MKLGLGLGFNNAHHGQQNSAVVLDISALSYDSANDYYYSGESARFREIAVSDDGATIIAISQANDKLFSYSLSTGWDLSTASKDAYEVTMATLGNSETNPQALFVKPDGTKLYYSGFSQDTVYQWSMSTPWDISTLSYDSKSFGLGGNCFTITLSRDGTKLYAIDNSTSSGTLRQYTLSTPWDISTASDSGNFYTDNSKFAGPVWISPDGQYLVLADIIADILRQYEFGTPWDISTLSEQVGITLDSSALTSDTHCSSVVIKPDDYSVIFNVGGTTRYIYQFS
ncbi:MAG: hypothetical protein AAF182_02290 [Pseudomonadota bacterium]